MQYENNVYRMLVINLMPLCYFKHEKTWNVSFLGVYDDSHYAKLFLNMGRRFHITTSDCHLPTKVLLYGST